MWQMPFKTSQCTVLHLGCHNKVFDYFMDNHKLDAVGEEKLGLLASWPMPTKLNKRMPKPVKHSELLLEQ